MSPSLPKPFLHQTVSAYLNIYAAYAVILALFLNIILRRRVHASKPRSQKLFPVWATIEIALATYILRRNGLARRVFSSVRRYDGSLFGLTSAHQILVDLPGVDRLMTQPHHILNAVPVQYTLFTRVFGGIGSPDLKTKLDKSWKDLLAPIERLFLNDASTAAALERACVPQQAACFVTFSPNLKRWELSANVRVIPSTESGQPQMVEADLQSLVRDFGACMAIPLLYGKDFLAQHPQLLDDFWKFDNDLFPLLMIGMPIWAPLKMIREGRAARARCLDALEALYRRIDQCQKGVPVDSNIDLSDVSDALFERNKVYEREGWSFPQRAAGDYAVFWGQNANTHPSLFWFLTYVYSTPGLVERIREEVAPFIALTTEPSPEITSMDLAGLSRCQLLKASIFETYRMANEPTSIRYIASPITIKDGEFEHHLNAGTFISAPHSISNQDPSVYADPHKFIPERFLSVDQKSGIPVARYGRLRPWGTGTSMCKGRTFAEKEIISLGAAIISLWDIAPASGQWHLPKTVPGTGVKRPCRDIRVLIKRRSL